MQQCVLSFNNRAEVLELPYPLQEWNVDNPHNTYTFTTVASGDVLAIGKKKLKQMVINSYFPRKQSPYLYSNNFPAPEQCISMIEKWEMSGKPIRVIILDTDVNLAMAIKNFNYGKADQDGSGDVAFSLELEEYSFLNVERSKRPPTEKGELKERPEEKTEETINSVKVKSGDTLWDYAEKHLGDGNKWKDIAKANNIKNGFDMKVGQDIVIPEVSK